MIKFSLLFLTFNIFANQIELGTVNKYFINDIEGRIRVQCRSDYGIETTFYNCHHQYLEPNTWVKFYNRTGVIADKVKITSFHEDGSERKKESKFDFEKGESKDKFNLWVLTLLQRPLLEYGNNLIEFSMLYENKSVQRGNFEVIVDYGKALVCPSKSYYSNNSDDCRYSNRLCNRYFSESSDCR